MPQQPIASSLICHVKTTADALNLRLHLKKESCLYIVPLLWKCGRVIHVSGSGTWFESGWVKPCRVIVCEGFTRLVKCLVGRFRSEISSARRVAVQYTCLFCVKKAASSKNWLEVTVTQKLLHATKQWPGQGSPPPKWTAEQIYLA